MDRNRAPKKPVPPKASEQRNFVVQEDAWIDDALKKQTVGLVRLEDFQRIKSEIAEKKNQAVDTGKVKSSAAAAAALRKRMRLKASLSFDVEEIEGGSEDLDNNDAEDLSERTLKKVKKDPMAKTAFLPDKEREAEEKRVMEELKAKWVKEQEEIQTQTMEFEFLVWDGVGVRKTVTCKKGDTIGDFLGFVKHKCDKFKGIPTDSLMFVKEDLIIPNHYSFYDFLISKITGKTGFLFSDDMHPPGWKVGGDTHPIPEKSLGKVMTRDWYAENKHIFPASKWTQFDPLIMQEHQHQGSGVQISFQEKVELLLKARNNRLTRRR